MDDIQKRLEKAKEQLTQATEQFNLGSVDNAGALAQIAIGNALVALALQGAYMQEARGVIAQEPVFQSPQEMDRQS